MVPGTLQIEVKINSVDVTSKILKWKTEEVWGVSINKADLVVSRRILELTPISEGDPITIKRGATSATSQFVFRGQIIRKTLNNGQLVFICKDRLLEAIKAEVTKSYDRNIDPEAGVLSEIFIDLVNTFTPLSADNTTVSNSGTLPEETLKKFVCRSADVYDKLEELRNLLNWQMFYDPVTDKVHFQPKGTTTFATTLQTGINILDNPKWIFNLDQLNNEVKIFGATQEDTLIEYKNGDALETVFNVARTPEITDVWVDFGAGFIKQDRGVTDSQPGDYEVDAELKTFTFNTAPLTGTSNIKLQYTTKIPVPVTLRNQTSIDKYGGEDKTPHKKSFFFTETLTVTDAEVKGNEILAKYSTPFTSTTLRIRDQLSINVGNFVSVIDNLNNQSGTYLVNKIVKTYPYSGDIITIGDKEWRTEDWQIDVAERIKTLFDELNKNQEILLHVEQFNHRKKLRRQTLTILKKNVAGVIMTWDNPVFGLWGKNNYGTITDASFILGNPKFGILGVSTLGEATVPSALWDAADTKYNELIKWDTQSGGFIQVYKATYPDCTC